MGTVYYDNETTGLAKAYDQIIQFFALATDFNDSEINQIIAKINVRNRRLPYVVPSPTAMMRTRIWPSHLENAEFSHFEGMGLIFDFMMSHSPADFMGHNILEFDEPILRSNFQKAMLPVYVTNTNGNQRGDTLKLAYAADMFAPKAIYAPKFKNKKGKEYRAFNLGALIHANRLDQDGDLDNQHDAESDTPMARNLALFVKKNAPHVWERMRQNQSKVDVQTFLEQTPLCVYGQFVYKVYPRIVVPIGVNPIRDTEYAVFDVLRYDPKVYADYTVAQLADAMMGDKKPIYVVPMNKQPILAPADWYPPYTGENLGSEQKPLSEEEKQKIQERMEYLRTNYKLRWAIKQAMQVRSQYYEDMSKAELAAQARRVARESVPDTCVPGCDVAQSGQQQAPAPEATDDALFKSGVKPTARKMADRARSMTDAPRSASHVPPRDAFQKTQPSEMPWYLMMPTEGENQPDGLRFLPRGRDPVQIFCRERLARLAPGLIRNLDDMDADTWRVFRAEMTSWEVRSGLVDRFQSKNLQRIALLTVFVNSPESLEKRQHDLVTRWANLSMRQTDPDIYTSLESHLYDGFPSAYDQDLMRKFHDEKTTWDERADMIGKFSKLHYNEIAALIVYAENPGSLKLEQRNGIARWIHERMNRTEHLAADIEEKVRTFLTGEGHERIDLIGEFDSGERPEAVDFSAFNEIIATVAWMEASPEMRELYKDQFEKYCSSYSHTRASKLITTYRRRFLGPAEDRRSYKEPTSCIPYMTTGKALVDALFLKYEGAHEVWEAEHKVEEIRRVEAKGADLKKAVALASKKQHEWQSRQQQLNAIVNYILDISKEPEMAQGKILFETNMDDIPDTLKEHVQSHLPKELRSETRLPLEVLLNALVIQLDAQTAAPVAGQQQEPVASQPQGNPEQMLPGGEIPQSEIVVPVVETQPVEEAKKPVRKPRKPKIQAPAPSYQPYTPSHLL